MGRALNTMYGVENWIGYAYMIFSWIDSVVVMEVEQISILDFTTFPDDLKQFDCFLKTFVPEQHLSAQ